MGAVLQRLRARGRRPGFIVVCLWALFLLLTAVRLRMGFGHLKALHGPSVAIAGAYHVHSARSHDSTTAAERWAEEAARLGLDFIVLTDHNVPRGEPAVLHGVLVLFEREASTPWGHRVEWPGGVIAAHPFDRKRPWMVTDASSMGLTGLEIASASAAVRALGGPLLVGLWPALAAFVVRPEAALAQLYARDHQALALWDGPMGGKLAGLCGNDAHGWAPLAHELTVWRMTLPQLPFERPLGVQHGEAILQELAHGRGQCVSGLLPREAEVTLSATDVDDITAAPPKATLPAHAARSVQAHLSMPPTMGRRAGTTVTLLKDGQVVCTTAGNVCRILAPKPGRYRAEVGVAVPNLLWGHSVQPLMYSASLTLEAREDG